MPLIHRILVPTDFSVHAERAFDYAAELAALYDAPLVVTHVYQTPMLFVAGEPVAAMPPDTEPTNSPRWLTASLLPAGRGELPQVRTTVASATASPSARHASARSSTASRSCEAAMATSLPRRATARRAADDQSAWLVSTAFGLTVSTGHVAMRTTFSAIDPSTRCLRPVRPWHALILNRPPRARSCRA